MSKKTISIVDIERQLIQMIEEKGWINIRKKEFLVKTGIDSKLFFDLFEIDFEDLMISFLENKKTVNYGKKNQNTRASKKISKAWFPFKILELATKFGYIGLSVNFISNYIGISASSLRKIYSIQDIKKLIIHQAIKENNTLVLDQINQLN